MKWPDSALVGDQIHQNRQKSHQISALCPVLGISTAIFTGVGCQLKLFVNASVVLINKAGREVPNRHNIGPVGGKAWTKG
jgi:Na+-translocating ferredoxin:NAD+ oxidoreductase RnfE subunit